MATMLDTITRSLRMAGIIEAGETPSAEDAQDGNIILNDMLHGWANEGADLGHKTLSQSDTIPYSDKYTETIRYNLAVRYGEEWGFPVSQRIAAQAAKGLEYLKARLLEYPDDLKVDRALQPQSFNRRNRGTYNIDEG